MNIQKKDSTIFSSKKSMFLAMVVLLCGCFSVKPSTNKSGKKYFETFYVGVDGSQYFIKPVRLFSDTKNQEVLLDMTFRYKDEIKDSAVVNFSVTSTTLIKSIDSLKLTNKVTNISTSEINLLFNEKNKTGFTSRFTTTLLLSKIKDMFDENSWQLTLQNDELTTSFKPSKKAAKAIIALKDKVFILM